MTAPLCTMTRAPQGAALANGDERIETRRLADYHPFPDERVGADDGPITDAGAGRDHGMGSDADPLAKDGGVRDDGGAMHAGLIDRRRGGEEGGNLAKGGTGRLHHDAGTPELLRIPRIHENGGGPAFPSQRLVLGIAEERKSGPGWRTGDH